MQNGGMDEQDKVVAVQIRVAPAVLRQAEIAAAREGLSVAAFTRRLLMLELERLLEQGKIES